MMGHVLWELSKVVTVMLGLHTHAHYATHGMPACINVCKSWIGFAENE